MPIPNLPRILAQIAYPGDTPAESNILRAWLNDHAADFDRIEFDLRLGHGIEPSPDLDPQFQELTRLNSQKRVDAMVWTGDQGVILEVKHRASLAAIGQISGYRLLYLAEHPSEPPPMMRIIALTADGDVLGVAEAYHVTVELVNAPMLPVGLPS